MFILIVKQQVQLHMNSRKHLFYLLLTFNCEMYYILRYIIVTSL